MLGFGILLWAIASCTISLHPIPAEKTKLSSKKISKICVPDFFFRNEILYYGYFYFRNTIISFLDFFSRMYYLSIPDFFVRKRILNFVSGFLFPKLNNHFRIYFSRIYYFQFRIFISEIKGIFGIFKIVLGAG